MSRTVAMLVIAFVLCEGADARAQVDQYREACYRSKATKYRNEYSDCQINPRGAVLDYRTLATCEGQVASDVIENAGKDLAPPIEITKQEECSRYDRYPWARCTIFYSYRGPVSPSDPRCQGR